MFKCGDKILYPMHGAGVVETIEEKNVLGENQKYYIVSLPTKNMKVMIPVNKSDALNLREITDAKMMPDVFDTFTKDYIDRGLNWNKRYKMNLEKVKTGDIFELADVINDLMQRDLMKGLSTGERKMLNDSKHLFVSEVVLSTGKPKAEIEDMIKTYY